MLEIIETIVVIAVSVRVFFWALLFRQEPQKYPGAESGHPVPGLFTAKLSFGLAIGMGIWEVFNLSQRGYDIYSLLAGYISVSFFWGAPALAYVFGYLVSFLWTLFDGWRWTRFGFWHG